MMCTLVAAGSAGRRRADVHSALGLSQLLARHPELADAYLEPSRLAAALVARGRTGPGPVGVGRWNTNIIDQLPSGVWLQAVLALALFILVARVVHAYAAAFALWIIGTAAIRRCSRLSGRHARPGALRRRVPPAVRRVRVARVRALPGPVVVGGGRPVPTTWKTGALRSCWCFLSRRWSRQLAILPDATPHVRFAPDRTLAEVAEGARPGSLATS